MVIWFIVMLQELRMAQRHATVIFEGNNACESLSKGEENFLTSKHISLRYHYLEEIFLEHIPTERQLADLLTKPLSTIRFTGLMRQVVDVGYEDGLMSGRD